MQKYNAETMPDVAYLTSGFNGHWFPSQRDTYTQQSHGKLTHYTRTDTIPKAPTEPVVPLSEVLELFDKVGFEFIERPAGHFSLLKISDIPKILKQKYGVSE